MLILEPDAITHYILGMDGHTEKQTGWAALVCIGLALLVLAVFGQTVRFDFVNYDDNLYVFEQPMVSQGLTPAGVVWAFTHVQAGNWHPLTGLSLMLDATLYRSWAGGFHLTSVLLHLATVLALFLVLRSMTGSLWRSAFVAALFAIHPLRAESVAWISERKDVLSGLFFMLTLGTYTRYARRSFSVLRYLLVMLPFALGLMSKPMLVTLPFVLLLLDFWPLGRWGEGVRSQESGVSGKKVGSQNRQSPIGNRQSKPHQRSTINYQFFFRLFAEKIPLLGLSLAACAAAVLAQGEGKAIIAAYKLPLLSRIGNALLAYGVYIRQLFWPDGLVPFYPHPARNLPFWGVYFSLVLLEAVSVAAWVWRKKHPYFITGWLWYMGMLVPVIGIMQVGSQAHADRYTYLPQIGLYWIIAWAAVAWLARRRFGKAVLALLAAAGVGSLAAAAYIQTGFWSDDATLWNRTLAAMPENYFAHSQMADYYVARGESARAVEHYEQAIQTNPNFAPYYINCGIELIALGRLDEAMACYQQALKVNPQLAEVYFNLGNLLSIQGKPEEAARNFQQGLAIKPQAAYAHYMLGLVLARQGDLSGAVAHFEQAARIRPDDVETLNSLAWVLATSKKASVRNGKRAVELAQQADRLSGGKNPSLLDTLAAAYAEAGRFPEAVAAAQRALELVGDAAPAIRERLKLYQEGVPYHE